MQASITIKPLSCDRDKAAEKDEKNLCGLSLGTIGDIMKKSRFFYIRYISVMFLLCLFFFTTCQDSSDNNEPAVIIDNPPVNPTGNTWIEFKNLEEFPVTIYSDPARQVVFTEIPANGTKKVSTEPAPMGKAFYPTFVLIYQIGTAVNVNIPYNGPSIMSAVLADKTNTVSIPKLESIVTNSAYITLINNSGFSLTFNEGLLEKSPLGGGLSIINNGQNASYDIKPISVSSYSVLRNGSTPVAFPSDLSEFKAGIIYVFIYNGTALSLTNQLPINTEITVPGNNLSMKLAWLQNNILSNKSYIIEITADENITPQTLFYSGKNGITITLIGVGTMRTINLSAQGNLFTIKSGITLILDNNITLNGINGNNTYVVGISGGTLKMNTGTKITGNFGGGVILPYNGNNNDINTFIMNGGEISGNSGGGVYMNSGGSSSFTINGGKISGNTAVNGGGVYKSNNGTFTMNGGEISNNTTIGDGSGVYLSSGTFTMNGGKIFNNTTNGSTSDGGGVFVSSTAIFIMKNGEISGNTATRYGGGVRTEYSYYSYTDSHNSGTFLMGGGVIYGNNATAGLKNTATTGPALYRELASIAHYGTFTGDNFYKSGDLETTNTTIRIVNGNLLTE